jgi:hypothetical protein
MQRRLSETFIFRKMRFAVKKSTVPSKTNKIKNKISTGAA